MNKNGLFAFYGTLRTGMENYVLYKEGMKFIASMPLAGYTMYSVGEYPYAVKCHDPEKVIKTDLFHVTDPVTAHAIHAMEIEAGYYYDEIIYREKLFGIYLFATPRPGDTEITSGDWIEHIRQIGF